MRLFYATVAFTARCLFRVLYGVRVTGMSRLPMHGPLLICSNHRSNLDPPLLGAFLKREVHYFAKAELFETKLGGWFLRKLNAFPVKRGQFDKSAMTACVSILSAENALVFFPEGTRAPADGFLEPKFGVGWVLAKTRADVLPVYLHGTGSAERFSSKRPQLELVIGIPVRAEALLEGTAENRDGYQVVAGRILDEIRKTSRLTTLAQFYEPGEVHSREVIEDERLR
ncbi:MAG: 1-acyl-sn-glycerol-3-phosphate acyltransferase [Calditrichaeota bacterium]|nr:1-acyl-sn-glycerol-3-phosphate acyltransferase [Calditrichota bacterium]MCB9366409.1 1-acyl-sn-glycerol-3-phosphate acyltransferase [Calditrichota bacterium]